jgi:hypothetical protein
MVLSEDELASDFDYNSNLALNPSQQTIAPNTTAQVKIVGGVPPYSFQVLAGGGTVDAIGNYTAPGSSTTAQIEVQDADGDSAYSTVIVTSQVSGGLGTALSLSASAVTINTGESTVITATGGTPPYSIQLASVGMGTLNGFTFNAGAISGNAWVRVTDSKGIQALISITIKEVAPDTTAIYVAYSNPAADHVYSAGTSEGTDAGYVYEGAKFKLATNLQLNTGPLYRCKTVVLSKHFLSRNMNCDGVGNIEFILGYMYMSQKTGTVPLYRFYNTSNADRIVVTDLNDGYQTGYFLEGLLGYVYPP